jgi:hypothetical protein
MGGVKEVTPFEIFGAVLLEEQQRGETTFPYNFVEFREAFYKAYLRNPGIMQCYGFSLNNHCSPILHEKVKMLHLTGRLKIRLEEGLAEIGCLNGIAEPKEEVKTVAKNICDSLENKTIA